MSEATATERLPSDQVEDASQGIFILITGLFFLSGSAGLVYQVLWMRSLGLFFGSDMYGVSIILSTFMGGLALGSYLGGQLAERSLRPLLWYGLAELGIGIFALLFASLLDAFDPFLRSVYPDTSEGAGWLYQLMRVALASGTLLIPTTMMGATLPLIMRHFVRSRSALGEMAAYFYAINTLGALCGTLAAGFVLLPYLGMTQSTLCAAVINLCIAAGCILLGSRATLPDSLRIHQPSQAEELDPLPDVDESARARIAQRALIAFGLSGFASFALEVVWTRILLMSFSATVYSFASMLSCFLFGIFLGSLLISKVVDRHKDPTGLFAALELGVGASVAALCLLINAVPSLFGTLLSGFARLFSENPGNALVASTLVASFVLLVIPTTLLGATFSVALRVYTTNVNRIGSRTGNLYSANTVGAILGSLAGGLVLIPALGVTATMALIAVLFTLNGLYLASAAGGFRVARLLEPKTSVPVLVTVVGATIALLIPYRLTLNFNQKAGAHTELLYHSEGIQNTIDVVRSRSGVTSLIIGGNIEADDGYTQKRHFILKGHLPLMFLEEPKSVLVVGLGMGITLGSTARHEGLERVDVIELSPEILEAQAELREINGDVVNNPLVHIRIEDGRSYMKMAESKYDMVTADPIHPKVSRVGYLYTREYYESIRKRLNPGGVVCQWMPIYQMAPKRLRSAMKTFAEVFPNSTFWYVKNHGLFIAKTDSPIIDYELLKRKFEQPALREDLASIDINSPEELLSLLLMGPDEIQAFVNAEPDVPINTDDYPYLEYFVPGDLFYEPVDNVRELVKHLADPTDFVRNQPAASVAALRKRIEGRADRLINELSRGAVSAR